jgi:hypothetical protein
MRRDAIRACAQAEFGKYFAAPSMIAVSARASGSVITDMMNCAEDKLMKAAAPQMTVTMVTNRETGLSNSTVILIIV